jgi:hypothetical protein
MRSKELSVELRDRIVLRHISGEGWQNISAALKVRSLEPPRLFLELAGRPAKLSNLGRRALVREVTKNPMVTLTEL